MSQRAWMAFYIADFKAKTYDLDAAEQGAYLAMLMLAWQREDAALPADIKWLKHALKCSIANFHGHQFNRIIPKLLDRFWTHCADGKFRNKRLTEEREKTDKRSVNGRQMANKRWFETRKINDLVSPHAMQLHQQSIRKSRESRSSTIVRLVDQGSKRDPKLLTTSKSLADIVKEKGWASNE